MHFAKNFPIRREFLTLPHITDIINLLLTYSTWNLQMPNKQHTTSKIFLFWRSSYLENGLGPPDKCKSSYSMSVWGRTPIRRSAFHVTGSNSLQGVGKIGVLAPCRKAIWTKTSSRLFEFPELFRELSVTSFDNFNIPPAANDKVESRKILLTAAMFDSYHVKMSWRLAVYCVSHATKRIVSRFFQKINFQ